MLAAYLDRRRRRRRRYIMSLYNVPHDQKSSNSDKSKNKRKRGRLHFQEEMKKIRTKIHVMEDEEKFEVEETNLRRYRENEEEEFVFMVRLGKYDWSEWNELKKTRLVVGLTRWYERVDEELEWTEKQLANVNSYMKTVQQITDLSKQLKRIPEKLFII